jgi:hypothetical protein
VSTRHSNFLSCNRVAKTGDATSPRNLSMIYDPKAYSTSPYNKAMKARNLSKSQKNLLDIVKHLDMQKRGVPKDKPASTLATMVDKNKFNVTLEPPQTADAPQLLPRPPTMQAVRALSTLRTGTADDTMSGGSRVPAPIRQTSPTPRNRAIEVLLHDKLRGPGALKINPKFRQYQVTKMVNHYFN